ncbi:hypothetical protein SAMN05720470_10450 [Fibrobacter sp. UWOV1]|uniref:hypothetical protein n=1 Tax=Fibrobacter sp. UWOV1 TaxID=1896215 RepID=UPI00091FE17A|nr:hypothetical protein [Fibrobacter sp. UWOV1]SHL01939.1 hypothetical protein SAMN05720470_10450 [Fibrobacter sp. UWOV1]
MKKLISAAGAAIVCSLGLVACGDSSSSPSSKKGQDYCKVVSSDPLVLETLEDGIYSKTSFEYSDERLVEKVEFDDQSIAKFACSSYMEDDDYGVVDCNGKSVVAYSGARLTKNEYKKLLNTFLSMCKEYDEPEDENSNSDPGDSNQFSESKSSSSAQGYQTGLSDYCEVVSENPFVMNMNFMGLPSTSRYSYSNGTVTVETEYENSAVVDSMCALEKNNYSYTNVRCKGNKITADFDETMSEREYTQLVKMYKESCINYKDWGNVETYFESSSSVAEVSSSSIEYEMEYSSSSSEFVIIDDSNGLVAGITYKKEKVVAMNAEDLVCDDGGETASLEGYTVAYEFNVPTDLGRDYLGTNHAYIADDVPAVAAECGSLVLDGTNGLLVPLSEEFRSKGFVAEVRFMPTAPGDIANIFVAEPPGSEKDGWQIRLDGSYVSFHYRDASLSYDWSVQKIDEVSMDEWHVIRVKIFPTKSELSGTIFYSMNISLDGSLHLASEFKGDISDIQYRLGIGYDSFKQSSHNRRFFTGKIDYIRYGKITEDNL